MRKLVLIFLGALGATQPAMAALPPYGFGRIQSLEDPADKHPELEARYTRDYRWCLANPQPTTLSQDMCNGQEMKRQDNRLNVEWRIVLNRLGKPAEIAELRAAERLWIIDRKQHCDDQSKVAEGGTIETLLYGSCMIDETIRRTIWLEHLR